MHSEGYGSCLCVCVCVCVCVCLSVYLLSHISPLECLLFLKILSHTQQATEVKKFVGFSLKRLHSIVMVSFAYHDILRGYCSDIPHTFLMTEPSKRPNKANIRLNATWNMTQCKAASFFIFSVCLLTKGLPYTSRYT